MKSSLYSYTVPGGSHWSFRLRRGLSLKLTDLTGDANVGMLFFNPENLLERYNAPDTLKCQHTFKLTEGHCLYSDMGRIFCSIVADSFGWHDTVCGNSSAQSIGARWGARNYQLDRNDWRQNGNDAFLVELAKYGLNTRDLAANVNWFSQVRVDAEGNLSRVDGASPVGASILLRFEMDTLVVLHTCPHPLCATAKYPDKPVAVELFASDPMTEDDACLTHCSENGRGFENNRLYHLGL